MSSDNVSFDLQGFSAPFLFFSLNSSAEFIYLSNSVEQVLGFSASEQIGRRFTDWLDLRHPLNQDRKHRFDTWFASGAQSLNITIACGINPNEKTLRVQTFRQPSLEGELGAHGVAVDITETLSLQRRLLDRLNELQIIHDQLSKMELSVLQMVRSGQLNKRIAVELDVTTRTIESARARVIRKYGAHTMAEAVGFAVEYETLIAISSMLGDSQR